MSYIIQQLICNNRWSVFHPYTTINYRLGILCHEMCCRISGPANVVYFPRIKNIEIIPSITFWIELVGLCTLKDFTTTWASLSTLIFLRLRSLAKMMPSSNAFASVSSTFKGSSTLSLITPVICPSSFFMTTPTP